MGQVADMMLDGTLDFQTGEYLGPAVGYPRTRHKQFDTFYTPEAEIVDENELKIKAVRRELAFLAKSLEKSGVKSTVALNSARQEMNKKYGDNWRSRGLIVNDDNQWTDDNKPDWWNEKLRRILQPGMDLGGSHLIGRKADVRYKGIVYTDCEILDYTGKRGNKRYTVKLTNQAKTTVKVKFSSFLSFTK